VNEGREMASLDKRSLAIHSLLLLCALSLFLTLAGSAHALAFSSQLQPQILSSTPAPPSLRPIQLQEQQPSSSTPPPAIPQEQATTEGVIAHGIIDSLIFAPSATWIASGNWTIGVNNGGLALVTANMTWYNDNGTASHTHEILNFRPTGVAGDGQQQQQPQQPIIVQSADSSVSLRGVVDVAANHRIVWNDVQSTIDIKKGGKILAISLNDAQTNNHFGGRPIFGIVTSFIRCSDVPGANMEMLQPCLNIPIPPPPQSAVTAPPLPTTTTPASPPPTIAANNTGSLVQNQTNLTASSPPPSLPPSLSSPSGNIPTNIPPPVSNATNQTTGKSPFDILGGG